MGFTINVLNSAVPVVGANVLVWTVDEVTLLAGGTTDDSGDVSVSLGPGKYKVVVDKELCLFYPVIVDVPVVGEGDPDPIVSVVGTELAVSLPNPPDRCMLYGTLVGADGSALSGVRVVAETVGGGTYKPFIVSDGSGDGVEQDHVLVTPEKMETISNTSGYWEFRLVIESLVRISIPQAKYAKVIRVPNQTQLHIRDARGVPEQAEVGITSDSPATNAFYGGQQGSLG